MAIIKESTFPSMGLNGEPMVRLLDELPSSGIEKTAGIHPEILAYKQQLEPEPGKTYVHILALGAGDFYGPNLNNDHFPWHGLQHDHTKTAHPHMHGYKTFLNAHAFAHHVNKDPEKAYGDVLVSALNRKMKRVELIVVIDEEKCVRNGGQRTLEKIKAGKYPSTSMGCRVPFDVCSICGHKAKYRREYCDHMRMNAGKLMGDGRKVFVYNPYPRFFDISFVFIGADRTSFVLEKVAHPRDMEKNAIINAIKGLNWTTKNMGARVLGGAATGGLTGAVSAEDGHRDIGAVKGALMGGLMGGTAGQLLSSGWKGTAAAGLMGGQFGGGAPSTGQPPPPQPITSTLQNNPLQKFAADKGKVGKLLRGKSGTNKKYMGVRIKRKVERQQKLKIRPITFSKLESGARRSEQAQRLFEAVTSPAPQITIRNGDFFMHRNVKTKDTEKAASLKSATVTKLSDIFKDVNAAPMGKAVPMAVGSEPDMCSGQLDRIAQTADLGQTLSGMGAAGVVLKPKEFQRVVLVRTGQSGLADELDQRHTVFPERAPVVRSMRITIRSPEQGAIPNGILDLVRNILPHRSALTPMFLRREEAPKVVVRVIRAPYGEHPMLDKMASLYNGYREDLLANTEGLIKAAMHTPVMMKEVASARGLGDVEGPALDAMMQLPLAYFSHAYWNRCCCDRALSNEAFAKKFTEDNPQLAKFIARSVAERATIH
jgi:hypothetical protein